MITQGGLYISMKANERRISTDIIHYIGSLVTLFAEIGFTLKSSAGNSSFGTAIQRKFLFTRQALQLSAYDSLSREPHLYSDIAKFRHVRRQGLRCPCSLKRLGRIPGRFCLQATVSYFRSAFRRSVSFTHVHRATISRVPNDFLSLNPNIFNS
jgi:hypothetical protein